MDLNSHQILVDCYYKFCVTDALVYLADTIVNHRLSSWVVVYLSPWVACRVWNLNQLHNLFYASYLLRPLIAQSLSVRVEQPEGIEIRPLGFRSRDVGMAGAGQL